MLERISKRGSEQMPPLASNVVDTNAVALLTEWINGDAVTFQSFADWQVVHFGDPKLPQAAATADPDADGQSNELEFLVGTDPLAALDPWRVSARLGNGVVQIRFPRIARRGFEVQVSGNFADPLGWQPLDVPSNRPFFSATTADAIVEDPIVDSHPRFYRVRVFEQ